MCCEVSDKTFIYSPTQAEYTQVTTHSGMPAHMQVQVGMLEAAECVHAYLHLRPEDLKDKQIIHCREEYHNKCSPYKL